MGDLTMKMLHGNVSNKYRTLQNDKVRVCFYGRVSTQHEAQMNALENQMQWYDSILSDHPNWEKINVYGIKVCAQHVRQSELYKRTEKDGSGSVLL